jgi:hypothetical protein
MSSAPTTNMAAESALSPGALKAKYGVFRVHHEIIGMQERGGLGGRVLTIRYEDLVKSFEPEITRVLEFVGLNDEAGRALARSRARSVDDNLISRRSPPPTFSPEVLETLRPLAESFGHTLE